jgi:hypothetical protein
MIGSSKKYIIPGLCISIAVKIMQSEPVQESPSEVYERSVQAARIADERIDSGHTIEIALDGIENLDLLRVTDLDQDTWEIIQVDKCLSGLITHDYYLVLSPRANFYLYDKIDKQEEQTLLLPSAKIALSKDDAWFFIYRLAYFGYPF